MAFVLLLSMTACGSKKEETVENKDDNKQEENIVAPDMQKVFAAMAEYLPEDGAAFDSEYVFNAYGVKPDDCKQQVVMSYYDGAATVELWLIEAVSEDALSGIKELAEARMISMCEQFSSYDSSAYEVAKNAKLITEDNCLVLIASENVDELLDVYYDSF